MPSREVDNSPFWVKLFKNLSVDENGCWIWMLSTVNGYGVIHRRVDGKIRSLRVHREMYKYAHGEIPDGLVIDHLCRVRNCANPDHLEAVTPSENIFRGIGMCARNYHKTHCKRGHELSGDNVRVIEVVRRRRVCVSCESHRRQKMYKDITERYS